MLVNKTAQTAITDMRVLRDHKDLTLLGMSVILDTTVLTEFRPNALLVSTNL